MSKTRVFQLTTDELHSIVKTATMAGITEFIKATTLVQAPHQAGAGDPSISGSLQHTDLNGDECHDKETTTRQKPWLICDKPGCSMPVTDDDIYCENHIIKKKKRGRPRKTEQLRNEKTPEGSLTVKEAAKHLNKSIWSVYDHIKKGDLIQVETGSKKKVTMGSIKALARKIKLSKT